MSRRFDVFNGDADGLFAAHQLRLAEPGPLGEEVAVVTGLKRDIALLRQLDPGEAAAAREVRVFDIALARNRDALDRLLAAGATVRWFDHHHAGEVPAHPRLRARIDTSPAVCSSLLVDRELNGRFRRWAVAAAFGDGLFAVAQAVGEAMGLDARQLAQLRELGEAVNYNGYGETPADALIAAEALYARLAGHEDPLRFIAADPIVTELAARRRADLAAALAVTPLHEAATGAVYVLPDQGWSRRVLGSFANLLAERASQRASAVLRGRPDGTYTVSVRAPAAAPRGADRLCRQFGGDGRAAAAGIDRLPAATVEEFARAFAAHDWGN